jgi:membrane protease YdiL (CAAX protease family)
VLNPFISRAGKLRNGWWIAIFFIVLAALLLPLMLLARGGEAAVPIWQQALVMIFASVICQKLRRRPISDLTGALDFRALQHGLAGLGLGAALMLMPALLLVAIGAVTLRANAGGLEALAGVAALMAAVAVAEEFLFRGFLFQRLIDGLGAWPAQLVVGGLFVLTHSDALGAAGALGWLAGVNIFIASLMFGFAYVRTGGLAMPIAIHFAANTMQGGVLGFGVSGDAEQGWFTPALSGPDWLTGGAFGLEASVPGLACVIVLAVALFFWRGSAEAPAH